MAFFSSWSKGDIIALAALIVGLVAATAAIVVVPEVRRFLRLDDSEPKGDPGRRNLRNDFTSHKKVGAFDKTAAIFESVLIGMLSVGFGLSGVVTAITEPNTSILNWGAQIVFSVLLAWGALVRARSVGN